MVFYPVLTFSKNSLDSLSLIRVLLWFVTKIGRNMIIFRFMTVMLHEYYKHESSGKCIKTRFSGVVIKKRQKNVIKFT